MKANLPVDLNIRDFVEEGGMDMIDTMTDVLKFHQQGAIDLTRLVLEHCKDEKVTKNYIFKTFEEAMNLLKVQMNQYSEEE